MSPRRAFLVKKRLVMSIGICSSLFIYGENCFDRIAASIAQSKLISGINKRCAQRCRLSGEPAPKEVQELGLRAQQEVGVGPDRVVPIRMVAMNKNSCTAAHADMHEISVNSNTLDRCSELDKQIIVFHEAVHIKHNDALCYRLVALGSSLTAYGVGIYYCTNYVDKYLGRTGDIIIPTLSCIASVILSRKLSSCYGQYVERRADTQALLAVKCHVCVNEYSNELENAIKTFSAELKKTTEILKKANNGDIKLTKEQESALNEDKTYYTKWMHMRMNNGYLLPKEMKNIAKRLEQQKLVCPEHQSQLATT